MIFRMILLIFFIILPDQISDCPDRCPDCHISIMYHRIFQSEFLSFLICHNKKACTCSDT